MSKHTPGPWIAGPIRGSGPEGSMIVHGPGSPVELQIADCRPLWEYRITREEAEANARLIAAAPDLLQACRCALADVLYDEESEHTLSSDTLSRLQAAIAKADGPKRS